MAFADTVTEVEPAGVPTGSTPERSYAMPSVDGVSVDVSNDVILARWENRVYAFSIKCPHRGARLEWRQSEQRVYCPKHKARFLADGTHYSGRGSRDLDRYSIRRDARGLVVDLGQPIRRDRNPDLWTQAFVSL
jgi:nitrite reductase/ring-hydroxylating ferredoxin subunit